jgi:hypothetical protein
MPNDKLINENTNSKYTAKSELERLSSVFNKLTKDAQTTQALPVNNPLDGDRPVLTMSLIGQLGRFAKQLFQYAFLRICAEQSGARLDI